MKTLLLTAIVGLLLLCAGHLAAINKKTVPYYWCNGPEDTRHPDCPK